MDEFYPRYRKMFEMKGGLRVSHEEDANGRHRAVIHDCPTIGDAVVGHSSSYENPAIAVYNRRRFIAFSAYYDDGGGFPIEQPLELTGGTQIYVDEDDFKNEDGYSRINVHTYAIVDADPGHVGRAKVIDVHHDCRDAGDSGLMKLMLDRAKDRA